MQGETDMLLSELFTALGIEADTGDVLSVEFTDETLLTVTQEDNDWRLTSLKPFTSDETLTVTMKDGTVYVIAVRDAQTESYSIGNFVTAANISGGSSSTSGDTWYINDPSGSYSISLHFAEQGMTQFPQLTDPSAEAMALTYQIPGGIKVDAQSGTCSFVHERFGATINIPWTLRSDGLLTFTLDNKTTVFTDGNRQFTAYDVFNDVTTGYIDFVCNGKWDGTSSNIEFSSSVQKTVTTETPPAGTLSLEKQGWIDDSDGRIHYKINARAEGGHVSSATIIDVLSNAPGITIDRSSLTVTQDWGESAGVDVKWNDTGFTAGLSNINAGKGIYFEYCADINYGLLDTDHDGKVQITADNSVTDGTTTKENRINQEKYYTSVGKSAGTASEAFEEGGKYYRTINWAVKANESGLADLSGTTISDTITSTTPPMIYSGTGITVKATKDGNTTTTEIPWTNLNAYDASSGWTYQVPQDAGKTAYEITYTTKVEVTNIEDKSYVRNTTTGAYGSSNAQGEVGPVHMYGVEKQYVSTSADGKTTWKITLTVPPTGLSTATVQDNVPQLNNYRDKLVSYSVDSTNLREGETYQESWKNDYGFEIKFYKDAAKTTEGFQPSGAERTVEITVVTELDQNWLDDNSVSSVHTNSARFNNLNVNATKSYPKRSISKTVVENNYPKIIEYNGVKYHILIYTVNLSGVDSAPIEIADSIDIDDVIYWSTNIRPDDQYNFWNDNLAVYGGDYEWENYAGSDKASVAQNRSSAVFTIPENALAKKADGSYYALYKLKYYMFIPVDKLQQKAIQADDLVGKANNTVTWDGHSISATYESNYDGLKKELLNEGDLGQNRNAQFKITINPLGAKVNNGAAYKLEDDFSSTLAVDYSSISFSDPSAVQSYEITGNKITIWIKDETPLVVTYNAKVIGDAGNIKIENTAKTEWASDKVESTRYYNAQSGAGGTSLFLNLMKVDGDNAKIRLAGVRFTLYGGTEAAEAALPENLAQRTFTTDDNGQVTVQGNGYYIYFDTPYYLVEDPTSVPAGYSPISYNPSFTISQNGTVDWDNYKFYNGYTLQVKNYLKKGNLAVVKTVESDDDADKTTREYSFTVAFYTDSNKTIPATNLNGTFGDVSITSGAGSFTITGQGTANITGVPEGLTYVVTEITPDDMITSYNGVVTGNASGQIVVNETSTVNVKNSISGTTGISVTKNWSDNGNAKSSRPTADEYKAKIHLWAGETDVTTTYASNITVTENQNNTYTVSANNLPTKINGSAVTYTMTEETTAHYTRTEGDEHQGNGGGWTNTLSKSVSATKAWKNPDNSTTPPTGASVVFWLYADGSKTTRYITLDGTADTNGETSEWVATFDNLNVYQDNGTMEIVYTIEETTAYPGYSPDHISVSDNGIITNAAVKLNGYKKWEGDPANTTHNNSEEVSLTLYRQAEGGNQETVNATPLWSDQATNDGYEYSYPLLPKYNVEGKEYTYWVVESRVDHYLNPEYSNTNSNETGKAFNGGTITNKKEAKGKLILKKVDAASASTATPIYLPGAKFDLYKKATTTGGTDERIQADLTTDGNGTITIDDVEPGTYYFVETQAPEGYVLPETLAERKTSEAEFAGGSATVTEVTLTKENTEEVKSWLKILKNVTGNACSKTDEFSFTITLYDVKLKKGSNNSDTTTYETGDKFVICTGEIFTIDDIKVKDDNTGVTINNIPVGTKYKIVEKDNVLGYTLVSKTNDSPNGTVTIPVDGITANFTNNKDLFGELKITKTVEGNALPATPKTFTFKVTLTPPATATLTGSTVKFGDVTYTVDGTSVYTTVNVTAGQTLTLTGIPHGWNYLVQEMNGSTALTEYGKDSDGYVLSSITGASGVINCIPTSGQTITVPEAKFHNVKNETGSFRIAKELAGNNPDTTQSFNVTVTITDENGTALSGNQTYKVDGVSTIFTNGSAEISVPANGTVTVSDIPNKYHYTITESTDYQNHYGYDAPQYRIREGTISTDSPSGTINYLENPLYTITNTRNTYGSLEIIKNVTGNAANKNKKFAFTIVFTDQDDQPVNLADMAFEVTCSGNYDESKLTRNGNTVTVELSDGKNLKIEHLPVGWKYTVTEADYSDDSYVTTSSKNSGTPTAARTATGAITSVPSTVTTTNAPTGSADTISYTNTKNDYGKLSIKKVSSGNSKNAADEFTVKVTLESAPTGKIKVNGAEQTYPSEGISLTIKDGETKEIDGIPNGTRYTVTETVNKGYTVSYQSLGTADNAAVADLDSNDTTFTGRIDINGDYDTKVKIRNAGVQVNNVLDKFGELDLTKTVVDTNSTTNSASITDTFHFEIKLPSSGFSGGTVKVYEDGSEITGSSNNTNFVNGTAQIYLKHNQTAKITGLPAGASYEVNEILEASQDYSKVITNAQGTIVAEGETGAPVTVTATNTKAQYGDLLIRKTVTGNAASLSDRFTFNLTFANPNGSAYVLTTTLPAGLTATNNTGEYTATVSANGSMRIEHILAGTHYTITESLNGSTTTGYIIASESVNPVTGSIESNAVSTAAFTNVKNLYGALTIAKETAGNDADKKSWFAFSIQVTDKDGQAITGDYSIAEYAENGTTIEKTGTVSFDANGYAGEYIETHVDPNKYPGEGNTKDSDYPIILTKNHKIMIFGLPNGAVYTITEKPLSSYMTTTNGKETGTITGYVSETDKATAAKYTETPSNLSEAEFTNTRDYFGKVKILKETTGNAATDAEDFDIYVSILNSNGTALTDSFPLGDQQGSGGTISPESSSSAYPGEYKLTLHGGQSCTIYNIPKWSKIAIVEPDKKEYDSVTYDYSVTSGELTTETINSSTYAVVGEKMITAKATNRKNRYGNLKISKTATGNATNSDDLFTFTVSLSGNELKDSYKTIKTSAGSSTTGTVSPDASHTITVELKAGETFEIRGLANGTAYEVTEGSAVTRNGQSVSGYTLGSSTGTKGTIVGDYTTVSDAENATSNGTHLKTAAFTNHRDAEGSLQIIKTLSGNDTDPTKLFTFTVELGSSSDTTRINNTFAASGAYESVTFTNGTATVQLNGGSNNSVTINGLPNGISYTVTETVETGSGYTASVVAAGTTGTAGTDGHSASGNIAELSPQKVTINNERNTYGSLEISKTVEGNGGDTSKLFTFSITLSDTSYSGGTITAPSGSGSSTAFASGTATVYLKHGEKATASDLPNGMTYTVTEDNYSADGYSTTATSASGKIVGNETKAAAFTNTRNSTGALKITKVVTGTGADLTKNFIIRITLPDNRDLTEKVSGVEFTNGVAYVELNGSNQNTITIDGLPNRAAYRVEEVTQDSSNNYTVIPNTGYEGYTAAYDAKASGTISETQTAETTVTNTYIRTGKANLEVTKKVTGETGGMTDAQKREPFTFKLVRDSANPATEEMPAPLQVSTSGDATVPDGIKAIFGDIKYHETGDYWYTIQEIRGNTPGMHYDTVVRYAKVTVTVDPRDHMKFATVVTYGTSKENCTQTKLTVTNQYTKPTKPTFEKKILDANDSQAKALTTPNELASATGWQDSADYDIGDRIPYRLTAVLASNVTDYHNYHITFHDTMDASLDFKGILAVYVGNTTINSSGYTLTTAQDQHSFDLTIHWEGENNNTIADTSLNCATVTVYFEAELNENANIGSKGNVNACYLEYSNKPDSNSTDFTQKDAVIAFTYEVDLSKVDQNQQALNGAAFKLQKKMADNSLKNIATISLPNDNVFAFKGLDDGDYVLTETRVPIGYKAIDPIHFTVTAAHTDLWNVSADINTALDLLPNRGNILTDLTGTVTTGQLTLTKATDLSKLSGSVENKKASIPKFEKKILDVNDSEAKALTTSMELVSATGWQDSADYDIGDPVPYKLTATLANNVTDYYKYHITFHDEMEDSLTLDPDSILVLVDGKTAGAMNASVSKTPSLHGFDVTLTWEGAKDGNEKYTGKITEDLNGKTVELYFFATLNEKAKLGKPGNVNTALLKYSTNPKLDANGNPEDDDHEHNEKSSPEDTVIAFTYKVKINKTDGTNVLPGATFALEKKLHDNNWRTVSLDAASTETTFVFKGLDDGIYRLTETTTPNGYETIVPITFEVKATHSATWDVSSALGVAKTREKVLTDLSGDAEEGKLTLTKETDLSGLTGDVVNLPSSVSAGVHKVWKDGENRDGKRPFTLTVRLLANGKVYSTETLTATNNWTLVKKDLPMLDAAGKEIVYIWEEVTPAGYTLESAVTSGTLTTLTNVYTPEKTSVSVKKVWNDNGNAGKTRPASVRVQLFANGKAEGKPVTLDASNGWAASWTELNKYKNGNAIRYTVEEVSVPAGYTAKVSGNAADGYVITNSIALASLAIEKNFSFGGKSPEELETRIEVPVQKVWVDLNNRDKNRPDSITVHLYADGERVATARLTEVGGWKNTFRDLPKYNRETFEEIVYTISEEPVAYYKTEISHYTIVNRYEPVLVDLSVSKIWDDDGNDMKIRPKSIHVTLSNGTSVLLSASNGWTATITDLPTVVNGQPVDYTWIEQEVPGYRQAGKTTAGDMTVFTNKIVKLVKVPADQPQPKVPGAIWYVFEEYDTALGGDILINHVGDCFD